MRRCAVLIPVAFLAHAIVWTWPLAVHLSSRIPHDPGDPIGFALRWRYPELADRLTIEGSLDGLTWSSLWQDWTGGPALAAALTNPIETPMRLTVPDVTVRYVRVRPAPAWLRRELRVYGPR